MGRTKIYSRDAILTSTTQLFWKRGFSDTSLSEIEAATGVNKSGLYAEFSDKDELFVECLAHYIQTGGVYELLERKPLGKANLVDFLKLGKSCSGQRGCFVVNSVRESAILPSSATQLIQSHLKKVKSLLIENIAHTKCGENADSIADLILTFNAGLCLEMNSNKKSPLDKIDSFIRVIQL